MYFLWLFVVRIGLDYGQLPVVVAVVVVAVVVVVVVVDVAVGNGFQLSRQENDGDNVTCRGGHDGYYPSSQHSTGSSWASSMVGLRYG